MTFLRSLYNGIRFLPAPLAGERFVLQLESVWKTPEPFHRGENRAPVKEVVPSPLGNLISHFQSITNAWKIALTFLEGQQLVHWKVGSVECAVMVITLGWFERMLGRVPWAKIPTPASNLPQSYLYSFKSSDFQTPVHVFLGNHEPYKCLYLVLPGGSLKIPGSISQHSGGATEEAAIAVTHRPIKLDKLRFWMKMFANECKYLNRRAAPRVQR